MNIYQGSKTQVFKKAHPIEVWGFSGFWALLVFRFFYLNEHFGSLLVDLSHQLSFIYLFYSDSSVL